MFKNMRIRTKLLITFTAIGIIPFTVMAFIHQSRSGEIISDQAFEKLRIGQEIKKAQIEEFFKKCGSDIRVLANHTELPEALSWFIGSFNEDGSISKDGYEYTVGKYGKSLSQFVDEYGYYDLLLITKGGKIVYSYRGESDLGQNIVNGPLKESSLGRNFPNGLNELTVVDFEAYSPSGNNYISFILSPFFGVDLSGSETSTEKRETLGVVALKINNAPINMIVQRRGGMGETGETFLVGKKDGKISFRTDSMAKDKTRIGQEVSQPFLEKALSGQPGSEIIANGGQSRLISYDPLKIEGLNWAVVSKIDKAEAFEELDKLKWLMTSFASLCIAIILAVALIFTRSIIKPIKKVLDRIRDIAEGEGDLTARIEIKRNDEMGELAKWFNGFLEKLQVMISYVTGNADTLDESSSLLSDLSQQMSEGSYQMSTKANSAASLGQEMSSKMDSIAEAMAEASKNVGLVAASAEEMTATIHEIAKNAERARSITGEAVSRTQSTSVKMDELGNAARDIGNVTESINEISEQTNLLALNATIEAARAGEAGKGFAVVAHEIKELAQQTADATQEIKERIGGIQNSTSVTVTEIEQTTKVINEVNEIVSVIAAAVEEQSTTTKGIAANVAQVSQGIQDVSKDVAQSSAVSTQVADTIGEVNHSADEMAKSSLQMHRSTSELSRLAAELKKLVNKFRA